MSAAFNDTPYSRMFWETRGVSTSNKRPYGTRGIVASYVEYLHKSSRIMEIWLNGDLLFPLTQGKVNSICELIEQGVDLKDAVMLIHLGNKL